MSLEAILKFKRGEEPMIGFNGDIQDLINKCLIFRFSLIFLLSFKIN